VSDSAKAHDLTFKILQSRRMADETDSPEARADFLGMADQYQAALTDLLRDQSGPEKIDRED